MHRYSTDSGVRELDCANDAQVEITIEANHKYELQLPSPPPNSSSFHATIHRSQLAR
jgi:hypothetical protein